MENTLKILSRVEKTHRNLGLPLILTKLIDFSDLGLFIIANRGRGKTTILDAIAKLRHRDVMKVSIVTFAGVAKMAEHLDNRSLTVINPDFSTFYTPYLKDVGVNLISALITDHAVAANTGKYRIHISNCFLSFLSAAQPKMIKALNYLDSWESMYKDRFIRLSLLYPYGTPDYTKQKIDVGEIFFQISTPESVVLPQSLRLEPTYERLKAVLTQQTSEGRCMQYLDSLLKAHAFLNNRDTVAPKDVKFLELFIPYLLLDRLLAKRERGVAEPLVFNPNSYMLFFYLIEHGSATKRQMREEFDVSHVTITQNLGPLLASNLVKGTYGRNEYKVNPDWYARYILPIINWSKEVGILK